MRRSIISPKWTRPAGCHRSLSLRDPQLQLCGPRCAARGRFANVMVLERHPRRRLLDAAVLAANDPAALNRWLGEHGYESRPALTAWLEPYTKGNWTVTAFRIATIDTTRPGIATTACGMTFPTDRPFFPYREPEDQRIESANPPPPRLLRTFFVGNGRHGGRLGGNQIWPGTDRLGKRPAGEGPHPPVRGVETAAPGR